MSGRIHDLITAENFAKWAEGRKLIDPAPDGTIGERCVVAQYLRAIGFTTAWMGVTDWKLRGEDFMSPAPKWACRTARAFDCWNRSGPTLAKIARENA